MNACIPPGTALSSCITSVFSTVRASFQVIYTHRNIKIIANVTGIKSILNTQNTLIFLQVLKSPTKRRLFCQRNPAIQRAYESMPHHQHVGAGLFYQTALTNWEACCSVLQGVAMFGGVLPTDRISMRNGGSKYLRMDQWIFATLTLCSHLLNCVLRTL